MNSMIPLTVTLAFCALSIHCHPGGRHGHGGAAMEVVKECIEQGDVVECLSAKALEAGATQDQIDEVTSLISNVDLSALQSCFESDDKKTCVQAVMGDAGVTEEQAKEVKNKLKQLFGGAKSGGGRQRRGNGGHGGGAMKVLKECIESDDFVDCLSEKAIEAGATQEQIDQVTTVLEDVDFTALGACFEADDKKACITDVMSDAGVTEEQVAEIKEQLRTLLGGGSGSGSGKKGGKKGGRGRRGNNSGGNKNGAMKVIKGCIQGDDDIQDCLAEKALAAGASQADIDAVFSLLEDVDFDELEACYESEDKKACVMEVMADAGITEEEGREIKKQLKALFEGASQGQKQGRNKRGHGRGSNSEGSSEEVKSGSTKGKRGSKKGGKKGGNNGNGGNDIMSALKSAAADCQDDISVSCITASLSSSGMSTSDMESAVSKLGGADVLVALEPCVSDVDPQTCVVDTLKVNGVSEQKAAKLAAKLVKVFGI